MAKARVEAIGNTVGTGLTARRGPKKTRRGPKVQRGPNSQTSFEVFEPRSTSDHAEFVHMQRIYSFYFILEFEVFMLV